MRTNSFLKHLILGAMLLITGKVVCQTSVLGNVALAPTNFLGWDNTFPTNNFPLEVRHDLDQPIQFWTSRYFRALINQKVTYGTLGSFSSIPADGFTLITPSDHFLGSNPKGPFSRLHLAEGEGDNAQPTGYRPWQRNGITFTGNGDQGYIGQKYNHGNESDFTDMVIQWSDNPGNWKGDRMRFIFSSAYNGASTGMNSEEGLEGMRLYPHEHDFINVGVGDFFADGTDPTERLHVLNGRVRIEELPNDMEAEGLTKVVVVDDAATDEHGVLKWMNIANLIPVDCDWDLNGGANNNLSTAFGGFSATCPDVNDAVGIGVDLGSTMANAKTTVVSTTFSEGLNVQNSTSGAGFIVGGQFSANGSGTGGLTSSGTRGIAATSSGAGPFAVGRAGDFISWDNSQFTNGVHAQTFGGTGEAAAVYGWCHSTAATNFGVYGRVDGNGTGDWAGLFAGNVNCTGTGYYVNGVFVASDESLKTNIVPLGSSLEVITQLQPKQYDFISGVHPDLSLPEGQQAGFLAQELQQVLPSLVRDARIPASRDSAGNVISESLDYKAVNYDGIVPYLVGAIQELNARNDALTTQMSDLQDALAACCANPDGSRMLDQGLNQPNELDGSLNGSEKLRIQPNPFNERTTVFYTLDRGGRTQLLANSSDGRDLRVLQEANLEAGSYQFDWNTAALAPGMYYVTLLLDGQPVVKRAVKVDR